MAKFYQTKQIPLLNILDILHDEILQGEKV